MAEIELLLRIERRWSWWPMFTMLGAGVLLRLISIDRAGKFLADHCIRIVAD